MTTESGKLAVSITLAGRTWRIHHRYVLGFNPRAAGVIAEIFTALATLGALVYLLRSSLISGRTTLIHDNVLWRYPVYQHFAESLLHGHIPFWNPFSHGGEPFYPLLIQLKFLDPIVLLSIFAGAAFTTDLMILFAWDRLIQCIVIAVGTYVVLRPWADRTFTRVALIPVLGLSSYTLGAFRVHATVDLFIWVPLIAWLLLRVLYYRDYQWHNWLLLGGLIGVNWQSYFFAGPWVFLLFFFAGIALFRRDLLLRAFRDRRFVWKRVGAATAIVAAMIAPNVILMIERDDYLYPARMVDLSDESLTPLGGPDQYEGKRVAGGTGQGIIMPYKLIIYTGTFSSIWDFIQGIDPGGNEHISWSGWRDWGKPSEAYMYLGFLPWAVSLLGIVMGRHDLKRVWGFTTLAFALLMLGPAGGLHPALYFVFPPLWFVRHTHIFVPFFLFGMLYFYVLGLNYIGTAWGLPSGGRSRPIGPDSGGSRHEPPYC